MIFNAWEHKTWGDNIQIIDKTEMEKLTITGWLSRKPVAGDEICFKMQSQKVAKYSVISVEDCSDPPDMFFANLEFRDYI